jgi:outer membrane protein OmpA-like peptidoglycan-associated protein
MKRLQYNIFIVLIAIVNTLSAQQTLFNQDAVRNSQVSPYHAINSAHLNFSPVIYGDGLVFIGNKEKGEVYDEEINEAYFELKYFSLNSESASISDFSPALNVDNVHKGPCSFSQQDRIIYYTKERRFRDGRDAVLRILKAYKDENDWIPDGEFPFNSDDFSNMHPAVSPDGSYMIFSSNREGGIGGYDLYISKYENGYWKEPENLGSAINSFGDESFPFIHENGSLIFSSDGRGGMGELDLFVTKIEKDNIWQLSQNLGEPFNSKADDFGMTITNEGSSGFFTSNRKGGKGKDDIYEFSTLESIFNVDGEVEKVVEENFQFSTVVLDKETKEPIKDAEIYAIPLVTNGTDLILSNFNINSIDVVSENDEIRINLKPKEGEVTRYLNISDDNGKSSFLMNRNKRYFLFAQKTGFFSAQTAIDAENIVPEITLLMSKEEPQEEESTSIYVPQPYTIEQALDRRELVVFNEIYYDYDSAILREGATNELDLLSDYLLKNPQLRVQLSSYTDARGQREYNQRLSQRRAQSAKTYLVNRGVSDFRVVASGRGENNIRNHCANGVSCSDVEHEYNRRTEVEILDY